MRCPRCKAENAPVAKFCGECGAPFNSSTKTAASEAGPAHGSKVSGERRHLTVLFCDLVGSTAIAARLDPEQWRETLAGFHRAATEAITRFDGHVAKYLGDGVMAYFGWPAAHDNDAERAARAGLAILDAIAKLNQQPGHAQLSARVGIDSGLVVIGKGAGTDAEVFGEVPNVASRVEAAAAAGTVLITAATQRLVAGLFVVEDRGAQELKGLERPLQLYRIVRPSGMRGRFSAMAAMRGMTPFVGREDELRSLLNRWERVVEGDGQVVTIIGEAGIGKSRLVQRFREELAATPFTWLECATAPFFQNTPFYAVADMLQQSFHWQASHTNEQRLAALEASLGLAGLDADEAVPLIAPLLELPVGDKYPPLSMAPEQQRRRLLATLVEWVLGSARAQPLVIATEDLHWADPSTLELIQLLVEQGTTARLLLLYTARPEFQAPWRARAHHAQINLNRLTAANVRAMVAQVAAKIALSDETIATVVDRTGGVPLFVEELTRAVLESGDVKRSGREIPSTLHDSLMARLDRLGPAKEVIQIGAVIGSKFSYELLHAVYPVAEEILQRALRSLTDAELVYVRGIAPEASYQFKHALIRDVAYEALLKTSRREWHKRIARTMEQQFSHLVEQSPEVVAHHLTEADVFLEGARYWRKAAQKAIERSAHREAITQTRRGLQTLSVLSVTDETMSEDVKLQATLIPPLTAILGYSSDEVETACDRARELCTRLGDKRWLFTILGGLFSVYYNRSDLIIARELAEQMMALAKTSASPIELLWAHYALGCALRDMGDLDLARNNFERSIELYDQQHRTSYGFVQDPGATARTFLGHLLIVLGYPDQGLKRSEEALTLARELGDPYTLAIVHGHCGIVCTERGEWRAGQEFIGRAMTIAKEQGFRILEALFNSWLGSALIRQGRVEEGIERARFCLARYLEIDPKLNATFERAVLVQAYRRAGRPEEGMAELEQLFRALTATSKHSLETEAWHVKGQLLLMLGLAETPEAERCFRRAIESARRQQAKLLELRATTSLARLLASQSRRDEAHTVLAEIYNWFTEGFDTADLKDAKALLDELAG